MSAKRRGTARDGRRRTLGQNFLVDPGTVDRLIRGLEIEPGELVVDLGAGTGALTLPLARAGAQVVAVERDRNWVGRLTQEVARAGLQSRVEVARADLRRFPLPRKTYRVVASPPFGLTTVILDRLLGDPTRGPWRADLLLRLEVARKRAARPPATLRSAAWAPWWTFEMGEVVPRWAFRPVPSLDAAVLTIRRRRPPVLPEWLAPHLREVLRPVWDPPVGRPGSARCG